jgi:hypothetical protein
MIRHQFIRHCFGVLATGAALAFAVAGDAAAGCCPAPAADCSCGPVAALVPVVPVPVEQIYVVNQGPVFSGPGPYVRQFSEAAPAAYPYVGPVFAGYPYGLQNSGGYPRGYYSPYTGYPYAEPAPRHAYRAHYRSVRAYPRYPR